MRNESDTVIDASSERAYLGNITSLEHPLCVRLFVEGVNTSCFYPMVRCVPAGMRHAHSSGRVNVGTYALLKFPLVH